MNSEKWRKVERIFHDALELGAGEQIAFLSKACGGDEELRLEVESLLKADKSDTKFLEKPAIEISDNQNNQQNDAKIGQNFNGYKILSLVGAGGMGEVYRAEDTSLERDVALKILSAAVVGDADRLRRFELEARSLGQLNHPNILAVYAVGSYENSPFVVSELLEGETLRERLDKTKLSPRKAVEFARQIANGLSAAHEKGIVHRDLKPENLFITTGGYVKILDFGLAKLTKPMIGESDDKAETLQQNNTQSGMVLGTVGYMSPEQVRGVKVDSRSDIFAFGAVLYEMLSGRRAFAGDSLFEAMNAIVKEEPPDLTKTKSGILPALAAIVRRCLEKNPAERFQSASDLAFALESLTFSTDGNSAERNALTTEIKSEETKRSFRSFFANWSKRTATLAVLFGLISLAAIAFSAFWAGEKANEKPLPAFRQATFRNGSVWTSRFAPDGQTVLYLANWDGNRRGLFTGRVGSPEFRALDFQVSSWILAISSTGEILFESADGALARASLAGGAAREILENISDADWLPDGSNFAVVRNAGGRNRVEFPVGNVLYETANRIYNMRVSPRGDRVAFWESPGDYVGTIVTIDRTGNKQILSQDWTTAYGLAWNPAGDEVWFTAAKIGNNTALYAAPLGGKERELLNAPGAITIYDVARDGRVLLTNSNWRWGILSLAAGETKEREMGWFDLSSVADISSDGKSVLFNEDGATVEKQAVAYLRKTDGSTAIKIGEGDAKALSPDGKWVILIREGENKQLTLMPTGAGETRQITNDALNHVDARWFPDGQKILFWGSEPQHKGRLFVQDLNGGEARPISPEGITRIGEISPDGKFVAAVSPEQKLTIYAVDGGEARIVSGAADGDRPIAWGADGKSIFVYQRNELPTKIFRLDIESGRKELWRELMTSDPTGIVDINKIVVAPDEKSYAYSYYRNLSQLYLVEGLK